MIERFLEQQPAICAALLSPQVRKSGSDICTLSETDISTAEKIASALKPMKDATLIMSEDSTPTLSVIGPLHSQLLHDTEAAGVAAAADTPVIREIKLAIHDDLAKRYSSARDKRMLYSASFLDPRFKALPFLTEDDQLDIHANVVSEAAALERQVNSEEAEVESETPQQEEGPAPKRRPSALITLLGKTFTEVSVVRRSSSSRAEEELKKYLEAPALSLSENPLSW
ncbi:E3 SUMO-protein ligase ZBED1-like [Misgurnus anguillicaudatus]|uniref:E3 SUMO-protein ligase ZBED1-like n=1 Tax=Misgurnus anguillicaudatus TaxID=75329 RepID=UPI003CCFCCEF